ELAKSNHVVEESLTGIVNVKSYSNEWLEYGRYSTATANYKKLALKSAVWRGLFVSFIVFFLFGAIAFIIWQGVRLTGAGELEMKELISFILFTVVLGGSFASVPELYSSLQKAIGGTERLMDILDEKPEVYQFDKPQQQLKLKGEVTFRDVHFHYASRPDVEVLKGINFKAAPGQQIALVGSSGSGKSTLMALLLRFYQPVSGTILVDGKEISSYDLTQYRNQLAFVPQEVILFGGTIRENIVYGKPGSTDEEIWLAAEKANAADFIRSFPEGLDTLVGDRGIQLSGGQKQRVSIARAVLRDPSILFLDEATSSLDSESEKLVQDALEKLMKGRTSFVIAHRLSTVRNADTILVLENGVIRETGNHGELVQLENGIYKKLSSLQFVYE
ncbi:MAG: ABC transporter ATP-binding protein, partial [Flavobacteriales bacterium]